MLRKMCGRAAAVAFAMAVVLAVAAPAIAAAPAVGSPGLGDPYFPLAGNGGYDVKHYSLTLDYVRAGNRLDATAVIVATATQNLSQFDLDLRGFTVSGVTVNLAPARVRRDGQELIVTPRHRLRAGRPFVVRVRYAGQPTEVIDPDGSSEGWVPTADGAFVVNEPQGSPGWYPANDNPRDKATFDFAITVPKGITAVGNGRLIWQSTRGGKTTWRWFEDSPMAPYLATVTNGVFQLRISHAGRIPLYHAVDPVEVPNGAFDRLAAEPEIIDFFSRLYGPYPFSSGGGVVDHAPEVGYALESQTKSQYDQTPDASDRGTRDLASVVRQQREPDRVARHLAQRGVRGLVGVDLRGASRRFDRPAGVRRGVRATGDRARSGRGRRRTSAAPSSCSPIRPTSVAR